MRSNMFKVISSYASWIITNYQAIAKINAATSALRLVSLEIDKKKGEAYFKIQITGCIIVNDLSHLINDIHSFDEEDAALIKIGAKINLH